MRAQTRWWVGLLAFGLVVSGISCNGGIDGLLDDGDSADVVLLVDNIPQFPPVTATFDATSGACIFTVTNVSVTLANEPKSELADTSPFNDIIMESVRLSYEWDDVAVPPTPTRTIPLGARIPATETGSVTFFPIALGDLTIASSGHSAGVSMLFRGHTVSGDTVTATGGAQLAVNACQ